MGQISRLEFDNLSIPIYLYIEYRSSVRYSITKKGLHIRIPKLVPGISPKKEVEKASIWIKKVIRQKPEVGLRFKILRYPEYFGISTTYRRYSITLIKSDRKSTTGKLIGEEIQIKIPANISPEVSHKGIPSVLSKLVGKDQMQWISRRVNELNQEYFRQKIGKVSLKYNKSNWGSCSSNKNINLSTRLLFAPMDVIDYVIIHELSHLEVMNHSPSYWNIVKKIMPEYKDKEKWLKINGGRCDFIVDSSSEH